jgi:hypothetical protein
LAGAEHIVRRLPTCDPRPVQPDRPDIAIPPFPPGLEWIGGSPPAAERLTARGPLLVHFFEVGELSGVQTLPALGGWAQRYREAGLTTLGVHSPRSGLARENEALTAALMRLNVVFPVANDREYRVWHAYGCKGWPSLFLWGRGGTLRWFHLGLGAYTETEDAIREELRAGDDQRTLPDPLAVSGIGDGELAKPSDEVFPGGGHDSYWQAGPGEPLEVEYAAGGCYAALDGSGEVSVGVDGEPPRRFRLDGPGLYEIALHDRHGVHEARIELEGPIRVWSLSFSPGRVER